MREEKLYIKLDGYEQSILVRALNDLRNSLLENARSTDAVDELIIKTANAKRKTVRGKENYEERGEQDGFPPCAFWYRPCNLAGS